MNNGSVHIPPTVSSPVELYVTNQLYIINNGKIDNQTNIPRYLTVYGSSISPDTNGSLYNGLFYIFNSGTNNIYWNLYAPNSYVYIENTDIYGAIISHIINIYSNGERVGIHFDKDLNNYLPSGIGLTSGGVVVKSRW